MATERDRKRALASYLECETTGLTLDPDDETRVCTAHSEYLVLTEAESESAMHEKLKQIKREMEAADDGQLPMTPELARMAGHGYVLSSFDGVEGQELVDGVPYFIYRLD